LSPEPLVLLPGFLCDRTVWEAQISALGAARQITVAEWARLDSIPAMAELVLQIAPPSFALAGHSMGGRVAFEVYRRAPDRVARIALMNTNYPPLPPGPPGEAETRGRQELLDLARAQGMRAMAQKWLQGMIAPHRQQDSELVERVIRMFERRTPDDFARQMRALLNRPDAGPVLSQVRCPALILTGAEDSWSPPQAHSRMHQAIAGSRLVIVPSCGHMSTMERPAEVAAALLDWLAAG
jgi:pimeloyl-ACP methyl ester carboxylesterase